METLGALDLNQDYFDISRLASARLRDGNMKD
jgi:hypothetical protein